MAYNNTYLQKLLLEWLQARTGLMGNRAAPEVPFAFFLAPLDFVRANTLLGPAAHIFFSYICIQFVHSCIFKIMTFSFHENTNESKAFF